MVNANILAPDYIGANFVSNIFIYLSNKRISSQEFMIITSWLIAVNTANLAAHLSEVRSYCPPNIILHKARDNIFANYHLFDLVSTKLPYLQSGTVLELEEHNQGVLLHLQSILAL
jgi:hypothetical protein